MSKLYQIKEECEQVWLERLGKERFERLRQNGFDIDEIVDLSREWDIALQRVLDETKVIRDDA